MKNLFTFAFFFLLCQFISAQVQGTIIYNETIKIQVEGMDEAMASMLPAEQTLKKQLTFKDGTTLYQNVKGEGVEDFEMESDDGSFKIKMVSDDTEDILYKNLKDNKSIHQKGLMGKSFVVTDKLKKHKWKITDEKIKYLDYECQKAVIEDEDKFVVAWFTSQIPVQMGPDMYQGLPGAILMLSIDDGKHEIMALSVDLTNIDEEDFNIPKKGKKVTEVEFQKIQAEKIKEMHEMHGSNSIQIRN